MNFRTDFRPLVSGVAGFTLLVLVQGGAVHGQEPELPELPEASEAAPDLLEATRGGELFQAVQQRLESGEIRAAVQLLDEAENSSHEPVNTADLHRARRLIAATFLRINNRRDAWNELDKLLDWEMAHLDDPVSLRQLAATLTLMTRLAREMDQLDQMVERCEVAIAALQPSPDETHSGDRQEDLRDALGKLRIVKAGLLAETGEREAAIELLRAEYSRLAELYEQDARSELNLAMFLRVISNLMSISGDPDDRRRLLEEYREILTSRMEAQPDNISYANQYLAGIRFRLQEVLVRDPAEARQLLTEAREVINRVLAANPSAERAMQQYMVAIDKMEILIRGQEKIGELRGSEAQTMNVDSWVNGDPVSAEQREGDVVLLDFWAIWNPASVQAIDRYKGLVEKYGDQGFRVIGVTRHYNIDWDFEKGVPRRSGQPVDPETENETLELFLQKQDVPWPSMIVNDVSSLFNDYGITGLPHAVLIDAEGRIHDIKVGSSDGITEDLERSIQELLDKGN